MALKRELKAKIIILICIKNRHARLIYIKGKRKN